MAKIRKGALVIYTAKHTTGKGPESQCVVEGVVKKIRFGSYHVEVTSIISVGEEWQAGVRVGIRLKAGADELQLRKGA